MELDGTLLVDKNYKHKKNHFKNKTWSSLCRTTDPRKSSVLTLLDGHTAPLNQGGGKGGGYKLTDN